MPLLLEQVFCDFHPLTVRVVVVVVVVVRQ